MGNLVLPGLLTQNNGSYLFAGRIVLRRNVKNVSSSAKLGFCFSSIAVSIILLPFPPLGINKQQGTVWETYEL